MADRLTEDLFDPKRLLKRMARSTDPETSHRAAEQMVRTGRRGSHAAKVFAVLAESGKWLFASEIAVMVGLAPYEVRKRLPELERDGLVERDQTRFSREQVWRAKR